jgi:integrase
MAAKVPYLHEYRDCRGKPRCYLRRHGKTVKLPVFEPTSEWFERYNAALGGIGQRGVRTSTAISEDSIDSLIQAYLQSADFKGGLSPTSQDTYRRLITKFADRSVAGSIAPIRFGTLPASKLERRHVLKVRDEMVEVPCSFNDTINRMSTVYEFGIDHELIENNPFKRIKKLKSNGTGFEPWSREDVAKFKARWPWGTSQRLALELLLLTAQRGGDIRVMGPHNVVDGMFVIDPSKAGNEVACDISPELRTHLNGLPRGQQTFIVNIWGRSFTKKSFCPWFSKAARDAGLKGRTAHGIRKSVPTWMVEAGATEQEAAAVTGHRSPRMIQHYTKTACQTQLSRSAWDKLNRHEAQLEAAQGNGG